MYGAGERKGQSPAVCCRRTLPTRVARDQGCTGRRAQHARTSFLDLKTNAICRILDYVAGSSFALAQLEAAFSRSVHAEVTSASLQDTHRQRWARLIAAETGFCLRIPPGILVDDSFKDGALAQIHGLKNKQDLNGRLVLVHGIAANNGRWACKLFHDGQVISCRRDNLVVVQGMLPMIALKQALCLRGISVELNGGWRSLTSAQFLSGMQLLEGIQIEKPRGRKQFIDTTRFANYRPGRHVCSRKGNIQLERILLAHVDVVFDDNHLPVVESFRQENMNAIGVAHSRPIEVEIDGERAELAVKFESTLDPGGCADDAAAIEPHVGLNVQLDLEEFKLKAKGDDDILVISCVLLSRSCEHIHTSHILTKFDSTDYTPAYRPWHGLYRCNQLHPFFRFSSTANGHHHVSSLVLYGGSAEEKVPVWSDSTWRSTPRFMEGSPAVRTASWNRNLPGTGRVPIIHPARNDQALEPFPESSFDDAIALLRRGGNGFAPKAAAAKAAGAVGCIIFDGDGPLDDWCLEPGCGLGFDGGAYPDPGIPTLLVGKEVGTRLSDAASAGAFAEILVDSSRETLMKLPLELEEFVNKVVAGDPLHLAVLIERDRREV